MLCSAGPRRVCLLLTETIFPNPYRRISKCGVIIQTPLDAPLAHVSKCPKPQNFGFKTLFCSLQTEVEDAVFIWSSEGTPAPYLTPPYKRMRHHHHHTPGASPTPHLPQPPYNNSSSSCGGSGSGSAGFVLDCVVPLEDTSSALVWLDVAGLAPLLAVGYGSGLVEMFSRDHR